MFIKYPREVISLSTSNINSKSQLSVIKKSNHSNRRFVITANLSQSDIAHTTEIYTTYGRFKTLIMNNRLYLYCEMRKPTHISTNMHKNEFLEGKCLLVSSELNNKIQNYLLVSSILKEYEDKYYELLFHNTNIKFKYTLSNSLVGVNSCLELFNTLISDPHLPNFKLDKTSLNLIKNISQSAQKLLISSYENTIK